MWKFKAVNPLTPRECFLDFFSEKVFELKKVKTEIKNFLKLYLSFVSFDFFLLDTSVFEYCQIEGTSHKSRAQRRSGG